MPSLAAKSHSDSKTSFSSDHFIYFTNYYLKKCVLIPERRGGATDTTQQEKTTFNQTMKVATRTQISSKRRSRYQGGCENRDGTRLLPDMACWRICRMMTSSHWQRRNNRRSTASSLYSGTIYRGVTRFGARPLHVSRWDEPRWFLSHRSCFSLGLGRHD